MSLILDALRKSEAERRRGQAPDLFAPVATRIAPTAKPSLALLVIAIAAIIIATAISFWPTQPESKKITRDADDTTENSTVAVVTPAPTPAPMPPRVSAAPPKPLPSASATKPSAATPPPAALPEPTAVQPSNDAALISSEPTVATTDVPDSNPADSEIALPTLATLDSATRAKVPPLKLSMHVWNEDATRRFAIIDGQRLLEGGRLAGVVVVAIRHDGVVLDIDGQQFLLPRP
jgi:general secretion pathway protein B